MTDLETHLDDESGLWIPPELRSFTGQVVFRTPRMTIQHYQSGGGDLDPYYGMIDATHFGDPEDLSTCLNPELAPDQVSIKPQGEEAVILPVATDPDPPLRTDGMGTESSTDERESEEWVLVLSAWPADEKGFDRPALERFDDRETAEDVRHEYATNDGLHPSDYRVVPREEIDSLPYGVSFDDCNERYLGADTSRTDTIESEQTDETVDESMDEYQRHRVTKWIQARVGHSTVQWGVIANAGLLTMMAGIADWHSAFVLSMLGTVVGGVGLWMFFDMAGAPAGEQSTEKGGEADV